MLSIVSNPKTSLPLSMLSIPAPISLSTHFLQNSQTFLTPSKNISLFRLKNQRKLQFKHCTITPKLLISCGITQITQIDEFSEWKSLWSPHLSCSTQRVRGTNHVHVGNVSESGTETYHYSVLAIPQKNVSEKLKKLKEKLRSEFGGPELEPHFTVVGPNVQTESDAIQKFRLACQGVKPYTATVEAVVRGPSFYECVYCLLQPSKEVLETAAHCSKFFGDNIPNNYMRHVSLIFGDFTDEVKQKIIERAEALCPSISSLSFQTSQFALYQIDQEDKTLKSWKKIDEYDLV